MAHNSRVGIDEILVKEKNDKIVQLGIEGDALKGEVNRKKAAGEGRKHCYQY